ncbi:MAG: Ig-like domain-containing protein, partial [Pseudomonadota bacterium]
MLNVDLQLSLRTTALALVACSSAVHADTALKFTSTPLLIDGSALSVGAVYRFVGVSETQYATVEVVSLHDVKLLSIDSNDADAAALVPQLWSQSSDGSARFAVTLYNAIDQSPQTIYSPVSVTPKSNRVGSVRLHTVSDFTHEYHSPLELAVDANATLSIGYRSVHTSEVITNDSAVSASVVNKERLIVDIQAADTGELSSSLLFDDLSYSNPVFQNVNDAPVAADDSNTFALNQTLDVTADDGLLANDYDPDRSIDDDLLTISSFLVNSIEHRINSTASIDEGFVTIDSNGAYQFVPAVNYAGSVAPISYKVVDGKGGSDIGALALSVERPDQVKRTAANADEISIVFDEDMDSDGYINREELEGQLDVSVLLADASETGFRVTVSDGSETETVIVNDTHLLEQRVTFAFGTPVDGQVIDIQVTLEDSQGALISQAGSQIRADLTASEKPSIAIVADEDDSGFLSATEHQNDIVVNVTLPAGVAVNDVVQLDYGSGNETRVVTPLDLAEGMITFTVPVALEGETLSVVAVVIDEANNRSESGSDSVLVDTTRPPQPTITSTLSASPLPVVSGEFPVNGDYGYAVTINSVTYVNADTALTIDADGSWQLEVPAANALTGGVYEVVATVTDIAGNSSADATTNELEVDLQPPDISVDGIAPSSDAAPVITGTTDNTDTGLLQIRTADGMSLCVALTDQGNWSCRVRRPLSTGTNNLIAQATDAAGNTAEQPFSVQVVFTSDSDGDGIADDIEGTADTDGDNVADYLDLDSDNDGITDLFEGMVDTDDDGIRDYLDSDADGDGIADSSEARTGTFTPN